MKNYRFSEREIREMKTNILVHIENEMENKTAWRLGLCLSMLATAGKVPQKERAKAERRLELFRRLTTENCLPNW